VPLIDYRLDGQIALVRMEDGKANALSAGMIAEIEAALAQAAGEAKAVVLAGRPDRFSAGFDLKVMMSSFEAALRGRTIERILGTLDEDMAAMSFGG
jgi:enoyl-CoA hydratase